MRTIQMAIEEDIVTKAGSNPDPGFRVGISDQNFLELR